MKTQTDNELQGEIGKRAYCLWEEAGRPHSRDTEFWLKAESEIRNAKQSTEPKAAPQKTGATRSAPTNIVPLKAETPNVSASRIPASRSNKPASQVRKG